jgi:membrane protein
LNWRRGIHETQRLPRSDEFDSLSPQSLKKVFLRAISAWNDIDAPRLGAALAFYAILSIAPLLVISIGIASLIFGEKAAQGQVMWQAQSLVGPEGGRLIQGLLQNAGKASSGKLATGIGLLLLLLGASSVFSELRDSLNSIWGVRSNTNIVKMIQQRFFAFAMVLGAGFLLMLSLVANALTAAAGRIFAGILPLPAPALHILATAVSFVAITFLFALLYKVVPDVQIEWVDVWIGAAVTSLLFSLGEFAIGFYLGRAGISSIYGAAGSLVATLVWIYYSAQIFFFGAEFTRVYSEQHGSHSTNAHHNRRL